MKISSKKNHATKAVQIVAVLVLSTLTAILFYPIPPRATPEQRLSATVRDYLRSVPDNDTWWLPSVPLVGAESRQQLEAKRDKIITLIGKYRSMGDMAARICDHAKTMPLSVMTRGGGGTLQITTLASGEGFNVTVIPKDMFGPFKEVWKINTPFYFSRSDSGYIFFPGMNMSDSFFAACFMHEYAHGLRSRDRNQETPTQEEVFAHSFSIGILKHGVREYEQRIRRIVQTRSRQDFKETLARLSVQDLRELDILVHGAQYGKDNAELSVVEHILAVGFSFVDAQGLPSNVKHEVYEWLDVVMKTK